jgi:hypothetical protein
MITAWYVIVSSMMIIYVVLDGRSFGAGMLHLYDARTPQERRQVIAATVRYDHGVSALTPQTSWRAHIVALQSLRACHN